MVDYADADLVTAILKPTDHLKARAEAHLALHDVVVPFSVGIELLFVARKHGVPCRDWIAAATRHFDVERADILLAAARALDLEQVGTVFDAVHAASALQDDGRLHTTDRKIRASGFPIKGW
ncbi:MAG: hypothetical protein ACPGQL_02750 [Thermoplasmatota archaeon]